MKIIRSCRPRGSKGAAGARAQYLADIPGRIASPPELGQARPNEENVLCVPDLNPEPPETGCTYVLTTSQCMHSWEICTETEAEGLNFVAGMPFGNDIYFASSIITTPYATRSVAGASATIPAILRLTERMHDLGHSLILMMHSHPGSGIDANHPSPTDLDTQRRFEQIWNMIGAIFSRDGYLRFFSYNLPFNVVIKGKGMERIEKNVYRLDV